MISERSVNASWSLLSLSLSGYSGYGKNIRRLVRMTTEDWIMAALQVVAVVALGAATDYGIRRHFGGRTGKRTTPSA
jgi:hypothetical protein